MGKHSGDVPTTGNGRTGGKKPARTQMAVRTKGGTILWKATAAIFGSSKRRKP